MKIVSLSAVCILGALLIGCVGQGASNPVTSPPAPTDPTLEEEAVQTRTYAPSSENFANPERGFYQQDVPLGLGEKRSPLNPQALSRLRAEGVSTLRLYFLIDEFRDAPISQDALEFIRAELGKVRAAGLKAIPRFAYTFPSGGSYPYKDPDAPLARVLGHIGQLEPVLRENADVIAFLELGFVGAWGEWHSSTNNLVDPPPNAKTNAASRAIVDRLLEALPPERMVAQRYLPYKQQMFGTDALTEAEAYNGSPKARVGAHNDCFLASPTDWGTYSGNAAVREAQKAFLAQDNRFLPQGGETCNFGPDAQPFVGCDNARLELARMHFSALNRGYLDKVYALWDAQGCLAEVRQKLGYRFRLLEGQVPGRARRGGTVTLRLKLANDGYARPYNPRALELVLRPQGGGEVKRIRFNPPQDLRLWLPGPGETGSLELKVALPSTLERGRYAVLLNLPDPMPSLSGIPAYSIRLANAGVWEEATGYNALGATLEVR